MSMNKDYNICYLESSYFVSATVNLWQNDGIWVSHIVVAYFKNFCMVAAALYNGYGCALCVGSVSGSTVLIELCCEV